MNTTHGTYPYDDELIKGVNPEKLAARDFLIAQIWVESGHKRTLVLFGKELARLLAKSKSSNPSAKPF